MSFTLDDAFAISEDAVFRELEGESVLLNLETGTYYGLDEVGTRVWQIFEETRSLRATRDRLLGEYETDAATLERDLLELARGLVDKGLWNTGGGNRGDRQP
jgi:hypothetical protein